MNVDLGKYKAHYESLQREITFLDTQVQTKKQELTRLLKFIQENDEHSEHHNP